MDEVEQLRVCRTYLEQIDNRGMWGNREPWESQLGRMAHFIACAACSGSYCSCCKDECDDIPRAPV